MITGNHQPDPTMLYFHYGFIICEWQYYHSMVGVIERGVTRFGRHSVAAVLLGMLIPAVIICHALLYNLLDREPYPGWYYIDAGLTAAAGIPVILLLLGFADKMQKQKMALHEALSKVRELESILPMCAACNKIRDSHGRWHNPDYYIREHTNTRVSHSYCDGCAGDIERDDIKHDTA